MVPRVQAALCAGYERMSAWAELLDEINVFPVADADTGRNLAISLAPFRDAWDSSEALVERLLKSATGNSGNIAACFFSGFLARDPTENLRRAAQDGRARASAAIVDPQPGTMLTLFEALEASLATVPADRIDTSIPAIVAELGKAVHATAGMLPALVEADVVDAGALGLYIFLESFLVRLAGGDGKCPPVTETFKGKLRVASTFQARAGSGYCVDTVIRAGSGSLAAIHRLSELAESVVVLPGRETVKIHLHTENRAALREHVESLGSLVRWSEEAIAPQIGSLVAARPAPAVHVVTDAAGSITREDARMLGLTLLDSYVLIENRSMPETLLAPSDLYAAMLAGTRVSTGQASVFERHERYRSLLSQHPRILYLCVGSVFTGNYDLVTAWKRDWDPDDRLAVIDTGAASGRLAVIALATARFARETDSAEAVWRFARAAVQRCEELIFLDCLKYLAAGGRLSKTKGFFGDLVGVRPVISPTSEGAARVGTVRNRSEGIRFCLEKLEKGLGEAAPGLILVEYSDNREWVETAVRPAVARQHPRAEILLRPLSLTSGAHMGPGTWAVAFLPTA